MEAMLINSFKVGLAVDQYHTHTRIIKSHLSRWVYTPDPRCYPLHGSIAMILRQEAQPFFSPGILLLCTS